MPSLRTTKAMPDDGSQQASITPTKVSPSADLQANNTSLPTINLNTSHPDLSTSTTLSRLKSLDLALRHALTGPTTARNTPNITSPIEHTARELQFWKDKLAEAESSPGRGDNDSTEGEATPGQMKYEIARLEILLDEQILEALWRGSETEKGIIERDIARQKAELKATTF